jgi:hypothetical protein
MSGILRGASFDVEPSSVVHWVYVMLIAARRRYPGAARAAGFATDIRRDDSAGFPQGKTVPAVKNRT